MAYVHTPIWTPLGTLWIRKLLHQVAKQQQETAQNSKQKQRKLCQIQMVSTQHSQQKFVAQTGLRVGGKVIANWKH